MNYKEKVKRGKSEHVYPGKKKSDDKAGRILQGKIFTLRDLGVGTVYRTKQANEAYKGKENYGKGKYFSLRLEEAKELTLNPHSEVVEHYNPKKHGKIDVYNPPTNLKVAVFDVESDRGLKELNDLVGIARSRKMDLSELLKDIDGMVILADGMNLNVGGSQLVMYRRISESKVQEESV